MGLWLTEFCITLPRPEANGEILLVPNFHPVIFPGARERSERQPSCASVTLDPILTCDALLASGLVSVANVSPPA